MQSNYRRLLLAILIFGATTLSQAQSDSLWDYLESIEGSDEWREHVKIKGVQFLNTDISKLLPLADKCEAYGLEHNDPVLLGAASNLRGLWLNHNGNPDSSIHQYKQAIQWLRQTDELKILARSYSYMSNSQYYSGHIHLQAIYSDSAFHLADSTDDVGLKRNLMFNRAFLMSNIGKPEETGRMLNRLYRDLLNDEEKDSLFIAQVALNLGQHYRHNVVDSAIHFTQIAYEISAAKGVDWLLANSLGQLAGYHVFKGDYTIAKDFLDRARKVYYRENDPYGLLMVLTNYAKYYENIENLELAAAYADSTILLSSSSGFQIWLRDAYELASRIQEKRGDFEGALQYHKDFKAISDSLEGADIRSQVALLELKFNTAQKEVELAKLRTEQRQRWIVYISGGAIFIFLIIFFIGMRNRARARQKISEKERQRLKAEVARAELEEQNLRREVSLKNQQLTAKALHLSQRNQLLESLLERIDKAQEGEGSMEKLLPSLTREIKLSLQSDSEWNEFRTYFEELNQDFFDKVKSEIADVTEKELRLLALTKIGLTIKEIAHLMHVAPNSVKTARYRLKKKLELDEEASLEEFVDTI